MAFGSATRCSTPIHPSVFCRDNCVRVNQDVPVFPNDVERFTGKLYITHKLFVVGLLTSEIESDISL